MGHVFICHATHDHAAAEQVCAALAATGTGTWIAPRDVPPGAEYAAAIVEAISSADALIVLLSQDATLSPHIARELERAVNAHVTILPVMLENVELPPAFEYYLAGQHWLIATTPPFEAHLPEITQAVAALGSRTVTGAAPAPAAVMPAAATGDAAPASFPLPHRLAVAPTTGFVGREDELGRLRALAGQTREGTARLVLIGAEPGMGKTALAATLARDAGEHGTLVLYGHCDEEGGFPYQPFVEALDQYIAAAPLAELTRYTAVHGADLALLTPSLAQRVSTLPQRRSTDPDAERYLVFGSVVGLMATVSTVRPILMVLDDLQWADKPSLQLLKHLVTASERTALLVLGIYRDTDVSAGDALANMLAELRREPNVERMTLTGLGESDISRMLATTAGKASALLARRLRQETGGNPYFTGELMLNMAESGAMKDLAGSRNVAAETLAVSLPQSVQEVIVQRVDRLGDEAFRILSVAAVLGADFDMDLLSTVAECDEDAMLSALESACAAHILEEVPSSAGRFTFHNVLLQQTLYAQLSTIRRRRLHQRAAEALEQLCGGAPGARVAELARHWLASSGSESMAKAVEYARCAGDRALTQLAPEEAVRWYRQALSAMPQAPDGDASVRCELLVQLGDAERQAGEPSFRETLLDAAHAAMALDETARLTRAALANFRGYINATGIVDAERVEVLEAALRAVGENESTDRALLLATLGSELAFSPADVERRLRLAGDAIAMARRLGDPAAIAHVINVGYYATWIPRTMAERLAQTAESERLAEQSGDPVLRFWAAFFRAMALMEVADIEGVDACLARLHGIAAAVEMPTLRWVSTWLRAWRALAGGDPESAESIANDAVQLGSDTGQPDAMMAFSTQLMASHQIRGVPLEMVPVMEQVAADNPGISAYPAALAYAYSDLDMHDKARELLDAARARSFDEHDDVALLSTLVLWAYAAARLSDTVAAAQLYERLRPWHAQVVNNAWTVQGPVAYSLGELATVLERYDEAETHFAEAERIGERLHSPYWLAFARAAWGDMLLRHGRDEDHDRAQQLLDGARAVAEARGYGVIARRATAVLGGATAAAGAAA